MFTLSKWKWSHAYVKVGGSCIWLLRTKQPSPLMCHELHVQVHDNVLFMFFNGSSPWVWNIPKLQGWTFEQNIALSWGALILGMLTIEDFTIHEIFVDCLGDSFLLKVVCGTSK
jgi:hypothetical protein